MVIIFILVLFFFSYSNISLFAIGNIGMIHVAMKSTKLYAITFETKITGILLEMIVVNQRHGLEVTM